MFFPKVIVLFKKNLSLNNKFSLQLEPISPHSPSVGYFKPTPVNKEVLEKRDELLKDKILNVKKKWQENNIKFIEDISVTYAKLHKPTGISAYNKVFIKINYNVYVFLC